MFLQENSNKIKRQIFMCLFLLTGMLASAQDIPFDATAHIQRYTISSPDVYSFEKYSLAEVNHYVGKPSITVPIFNLESGSLRYPITLSYDAGGIKVDQLASNVGLGWNLSKTLITRIINQDNDFNNLANNMHDHDGISPSDPNYYAPAPNELYYETNAKSKGLGNVGYFLAKRRSLKMGFFNKNVDFLPDNYNFYTHDKRTSFFFLDENTPVELNPKGSKIYATKGKQVFPANLITSDGTAMYDFPSQDFYSITVITNDGIKYIFNDYDVSMSYTPKTRTDYFAPGQISAWHISKIIDTKTGDSIDFEYEITSANPPNSNISSVTQKSYNYTCLATNAENEPCEYYTRDDRTTKNLTITHRIDLRLSKLKKIKFKGGYVSFQYNGEDPVNGGGGNRLDIFRGFCITKILMHNNNNDVINYFDLNYSYFESARNVGEFNPDNPLSNDMRRYKRLKLNSIKERGNPPYVFGYEESIKLPPINSFSFDFLGYYNNSPDVQNIEQLTSLRPAPTLYRYPDKYELSLLPFKAGEAYYLFEGYFDRTANNYAKAWTLNKISYPLGGSSEFFYEPNSFEIFGHAVTGGGIRIYQQKLKDNMGSTRTVNYEYSKPNGSTSGTLASVPVFGHPTVKLYDVIDDNGNFVPMGASQDMTYWKLFDRSNVNEDITNGGYVGYSRVTVWEQDNGHKEFKFTSNDTEDCKNVIRRSERYSPAQTDLFSSNHACISNFLILNSGIGSNFYTDRSYRRGKLLEERIFDEFRGRVKTTKIDYALQSYSFHEFMQPINQPIFNYNADHNIKHLMTAFKNYDIASYLPSHKKVTTYDSSFTNVLETDESFTYDNHGNIKYQNISGSDPDIQTEIIHYYAKEVASISSLPGGNLSPSEFQSIAALNSVAINATGTKIQTEKYLDRNLFQRNRMVYSQNAGSAVVNLKGNKSAFREGAALVEDLVIYKYDSSNNPIEFSLKQGARTVLIWGYKGTKIIAKIENINYDLISQSSIVSLKTLSDSEYSEVAEQTLLAALKAFKANLENSFTETLITVYTHDPLIGVKSITNPAGTTTYYEYDNENRLRLTRDNEKKIITEHNYHVQN